MWCSTVYPMIRFTISVTEEEHELLTLIARHTHRSVSNLVRSMIGDLAPVLSQVVQAKTAREVSAYLDALEERNRETAAAARKALDLGEGPPPSNTGVTR